MKQNKFLTVLFIFVVLAFTIIQLVSVVSFTITSSAIVFHLFDRFRADELSGFMPYLMLFSWPLWILGVAKGLISSFEALIKKRKEAKQKNNNSKK